MRFFNKFPRSRGPDPPPPPPGRAGCNEAERNPSELDALIQRYKNQGSLDGSLNQLEETLLMQISELADAGSLKAVQEQLEERAE